MANGLRTQPQSSPAVMVGLVVAVAVLASPLYISLLQSSATRTEAEIATGVESIRRTIENIDASLLNAEELRERLVRSEVVMTAESSKAAADAKSKPLDALQLDLSSGKGLQTDRYIADAEKQSADIMGGKSESAPKGIPNKAGFATESFNKLKEAIKHNKDLLAKADSEVKRIGALAGAKDDVNFNRVAATLAWMRGRAESDRAWLDRFHAAALRGVAHEQIMDVARLRQLSTAAAGRVPGQPIEVAEGTKTAMEAAVKTLKDQSAELTKKVDERRDRIEQLRKFASDKRKEMSDMELRPFRAANRRQAGTEFDSYRRKFEGLSSAARKAEYDADTLAFGALEGGTMVESATSDMLSSSYEGTSSPGGLVEMEARLAALNDSIKLFEDAIADQGRELEGMNEARAKLEEKKTALTKAADDRAAELEKTIGDAAAEMAKARKSEDAARKAFTEGDRLAADAAAAASTRQTKAGQVKSDAGGAEVSDRLTQILGDKDTRPAALVLQAALQWSKAETYAHAVEDVEAQQRLLTAREKIIGGAAPDDDTKTLDELRKAGNAALAAALKTLGTAKTEMSGGSYDLPDGGKVSGAAMKWQISQLEGAVHMIGMLLAESEEAAKDARSKARAALQEAVAGRETSPNLQNAVDAIKELE